MSKILGIYDGIGAPDTFIQEFKTTAQFMNWNSDAQLRNLPIFLQGKALRVFNAIGDKDSIDKTLNGLRTGCMPSSQSLMLLFFKRTLGKTELISEYALALKEILQAAMPNLPPAYQVLLLRSRLCLSLPKDLQSQADNLTWDQLLVKLDKMDVPRPKRGGNNRRSHGSHIQRGQNSFQSDDSCW